MNNSKLFKQGKEFEKQGDTERAYQYYLEAVLSEDDGEAMYALADMYYDNTPYNDDNNKAGRYYGLAFDRGVDVDSWKLIIAGSYWQERANETGDVEDRLLAIRYYKAAAESGTDYGYDCLAELYFELHYYEKAYECLKKPEKLEPCGMYYMGKLYEEGLGGVGKDLDKAIDYYRRVIARHAPYEEEYGEDTHCELAKKRLQKLASSFC